MFKDLNIKSLNYLYIAIVMIIADQISKWAVTELIIAPALKRVNVGLWDWITDAPARLDFYSTEILPFFNIVMVWNYGISFGAFNDPDGMVMPVILSAFAILLCVAFIIWMMKSDSRLQKTAIALVIGGALGNVIDRFRFGAVIDFIDIHAMGYHWPAFNIADSVIFIGVLLLIIHGFFFEKDSEQS